MTQPDQVTRQEGRVIAAECAYWAADLACTTALAQLDAAVKAKTMAARHLIDEQRKLSQPTP